MRIRKPVQNGSMTSISSRLRQRSELRAIASAIGYPASRQIAVDSPATFRLSSNARA